MDAWRSLSANVLAPWQLRALIEASRAWVAEHQSAADPDAPAPWSEAPVELDRQAVGDKVRAVFGARAHARRKG